MQTNNTSTNISTKNKSISQGVYKENISNLITNSNPSSAINSFCELTTTVLIISNISRNLTRRHLQEIFSFYGPMKGAYIPKDEESKLNKNYAYLEFMNKEDAERAILYMSEGQIDGLKVKLEILSPPVKESYTNRDRENRDSDKIDRDIQRDERKDYNSNTGSRNFSSLKRRRSRSRSRRGSPSNKYRGMNFHNRRNRSRSNNRRHHRKSSFSSRSSQRTSSDSSHKSSSS